MQKVIIVSFCFISMLHAMEQPPAELFIGMAQEEHIPMLTALSKEVIDEFFRPLMLVEHPDNPLAKNSQLLNKFLVNLDDGFVRHLKRVTSSTENSDGYVVVASNNEDPNNILGFCAFTKKEDFIYVHYIAVSQHVRGKGIGKGLLNAALSTYKDVFLCKLKTFAYGNEATQAFYERLGFTSRGLCTLVEGAPNTHIMYQLDIKK